MGATRNTGYLENLIAYDASDNVAIATTAIDNAFKITMGGSVKMTGALNGTSATFSGIVEVGNTVGSAINSASGLGNLVVGNGGASSQGITIYTGASTYGGLNFADATTGGGAYAGYIKFDHSDNSMGFFIGNVSRLSLASTGAATFSSSVTAGSNIILPSGFELSYGNGNVSILGNTSTNTMELRTNNSTKLTIASTGAATFSSSVTTAGDVLIQNANPILNLQRSNNASSPAARINFLTSDNTVRWQIATNQAVGTGFEINQGDGATNRLYINTSGNVGIGTTSPQSNLHVTGTIKVATGNAQGILGLGEGAGTTVNVGIWRGAANAPTTDGNYLNLGGYDGIVFATGNAAIGSQTERMRITSGGNVGIGTTSPLGPIHAVNTSSYSAPATTGNSIGHAIFGKLTDSGIAIGSFRGAGTSGYTWFQAQILDAAQYNNNIVFQPNGGNVGIGTASPAIKLEVASSGSNSFFRNPSSTAATTYITVVNANNTSNGLVMAHISDGTGYIGTQNSADLRFVTGDAEKMRITSGGNVGIGSTSAAVLLTIGKIGTANQIGFYDSGTAKGFIGVSAGTSDIISTDALNDMVIRPSSAGNLLFAIGSTERMRITSGGLVGIGTTSPANTLHISSTGGTLDTLTNVISRFNATTNTSGQGSGIALTAVATKETAVILSAEHTSGNNGDFVVKVYNGGATYPERMRITSGGTVLVGTTSDNGYSKFQVNGNISLGAGSGNTAILDSGNTYVTLANNATQNFASFSGFIIVNNYSTGAIQLFVVGGGSTASVYLLGGALGTIAYNGSINGYIFTNNTGVTNIYNFTAIRTRVNA